MNHELSKKLLGFLVTYQEELVYEHSQVPEGTGRMEKQIFISQRHSWISDLIKEVEEAAKNS